MSRRSKVIHFPLVAARRAAAVFLARHLVEQRAPGSVVVNREQLRRRGAGERCYLAAKPEYGELLSNTEAEQDGDCEPFERQGALREQPRRQYRKTGAGAPTRFAGLSHMDRVNSSLDTRHMLAGLDNREGVIVDHVQGSAIGQPEIFQPVDERSAPLHRVVGNAFLKDKHVMDCSVLSPHFEPVRHVCHWSVPPSRRKLLRRRVQLNLY